MKKYTNKTIIKSNTAITLIALIITIIILLILAGVTLNMVMGDSGIFRKANTASEETNKTQALEELRLKVLELQTKTQAEKNRMATLKDVVDALNEDVQNEYEVYLEIATIKGTVPTITDDTDKIYVKYKSYKFQIDNNLVVTFIGESNTEVGSGDKEENNVEKDEVTYNYVVDKTIPQLSSNDSEKGSVICSSYWDKKYLGWKAFNNDLSTAWNPDGSVGNQYLGFKYKNPTVINKFELQFPIEMSGVGEYPQWCVPEQFSIMASNDGVNYIELGSYTIEDKYTKDLLTFNVDNQKEYIYYKIQYYQETAQTDGGDDVLIGYLQFYGYEKYYEAIETLTSNTGTMGNVFASSRWEGTETFEEYKAFNNDISNGWNASGEVGTQYIGCEFNKKTKVKGFLFERSTYNDKVCIPYNISFKASNDGINYVTLGTYELSDEIRENCIYYSIENNSYYKFYKIEYNQEVAQTDGGLDIMFGRIQMYK